jgi:hemerythrin
MPLISWNKSFELGIEPFDDHHKHLVSLINTVFEGMNTGSSGEVIGSVLDALFDYATYHFDAEEQWLSNKKYQELAVHRIEHERFCTRILEIKNDYINGNEKLSLEVMQFLKGWLTNHILVSDMKYRQFVM